MTDSRKAKDIYGMVRTGDLLKGSVQFVQTIVFDDRPRRFVVVLLDAGAKAIAPCIMCCPVSEGDRVVCRVFDWKFLRRYRPFGDVAVGISQGCTV